jgi:hypothetical protein
MDCNVVDFLHGRHSVTMLPHYRATVTICAAVFNVRYRVPSENALHFYLGKPGSKLCQGYQYSVVSLSPFST